MHTPARSNVVLYTRNTPTRSAFGACTLNGLYHTLWSLPVKPEVGHVRYTLAMVIVCKEGSGDELNTWSMTSCLSYCACIALCPSVYLCLPPLADYIWYWGLASWARLLFPTWHRMVSSKFSGKSKFSLSHYESWESRSIYN